MKKTRISKVRVNQEMASEYRFDYSKAKPNRFAEKMNLNVGWIVERFVGGKDIVLERKNGAPKKR